VVFGETESELGFIGELVAGAELGVEAPVLGEGAYVI
jgi:hypothetical protein